MYHYFVRKNKSFVRRRDRCSYKMLSVRSADVIPLVITKTGRHFYAQVLSQSGNVLASSSTVSKDFRAISNLKLGEQNGANAKNAKIVAEILAKKVAQLEEYKSGSFCVLDRRGNKFCGVIASFKEEMENLGIRFSRSIVKTLGTEYAE